jgi:signal transduction histidine kinase
MAVTSASPVRREMRVLVGALVVLLCVLIVTLIALALSILRIDRLSSIADAVRDTVAPTVSTASRDVLTARLESLRISNDITRIEIYRGNVLTASAGESVPSAEIITRPLPGGKMLFYFNAAGFIGGRRNALIVSALATMATMAGVLILTLYLPKFMRPLEEMLAHAPLIGERERGDDDARYLVHSFREAVERIQTQAQELDHLRDATSERAPDVRELARALNRSFTSGFLALDANGSVVAINDAGREMLDVDASTPAETIALESLAPSFAHIVRESFDGRTALSRHEVLLERSQSLIGVTTVPLFEENAFIGMFALFTDLTAFRAMEGRVRDLETLVGLGQMSAGIAHEFRNSLFTILGYLRLAQRDASDETATRIRNAEAEAKKLAAAVDALLNFARPLTIRAQRVRLDDIVRDVVERFRHDAQDIRFSFRADAPVEINGDRELLDLALENIVRNAVDAARQQHPNGGGDVAAQVSAAEHPTIVVRDNGVGVEPERAATLLLPFQSGKQHGFGLGLPLARKIILHHGGTLSLTGSPGAGATVTIEFYR